MKNVPINTGVGGCYEPGSDNALFYNHRYAGHEYRMAAPPPGYVLVLRGITGCRGYERVLAISAGAHVSLAHRWLDLPVARLVRARCWSGYKYVPAELARRCVIDDATTLPPEAVWPEQARPQLFEPDSFVAKYLWLKDGRLPDGRRAGNDREQDAVARRFATLGTSDAVCKEAEVLAAQRRAAGLDVATGLDLTVLDWVESRMALLDGAPEPAKPTKPASRTALSSVTPFVPPLTIIAQSKACQAWIVRDAAGSEFLLPGAYLSTARSMGATNPDGAAPRHPGAHPDHVASTLHALLPFHQHVRAAWIRFRQARPSTWEPEWAVKICVGHDDELPELTGHEIRAFQNKEK